MSKKRIVAFEPYENLQEALKLILAEDYDLVSVGTFNQALGEIERLQTELFILEVDDKEIGFERIEEATRLFPGLTLLLTSVDLDWPFKEKVLKAFKTSRIRFQDKPYEAKELKERVNLIVNGDTDRHTFILKVPAAF